jgi:LuxR family maltose regulon positive regulatory protein
VLLLLDDHLGTDEIAGRLYISEHTVRSHVKSLLRKLGVSSRREALERLAYARAA